MPICRWELNLLRRLPLLFDPTGESPLPSGICALARPRINLSALSVKFISAAMLTTTSVRNRLHRRADDLIARAITA